MFLQRFFKAFRAERVDVVADDIDVVAELKEDLREGRINDEQFDALLRVHDISERIEETLGRPSRGSLNSRPWIAPTF